MFMDAAFGGRVGRAYRTRAFAGATACLDRDAADSETLPAFGAESALGSVGRMRPSGPGYLIGRMAVRLVLSASVVTWTKVTSPAR